MKLKLASLLIIFSFLTACKQDVFHGKLPLSTGKPGELFIIADQSYLSDASKKALKGIFYVEQPLYGAPEPYYRVSFMLPGSTRGGLLYQGLLVLVCNTQTESETLKLLSPQADSLVKARQKQGKQVHYLRDVWAKAQGVIILTPTSPKELQELIAKKAGEILNQAVEMERQEQTYKMTLAPDAKTRKTISEKHQLDVKVPIRYHIAAIGNPKPDEGLIWIRNQTEKADLNVVIHYEPYIDTSQFSLSYMISRRDTVLKKYITGAPANSYMATETQFPFFTVDTRHNQQFAREYYGLWTMQNDAMGGPYYSITFVQTSQNRIVTLEGFVFAPGQDKTPYIRELQGILMGIKPL